MTSTQEELVLSSSERTLKNSAASVNTPGISSIGYSVLKRFMDICLSIAGIVLFTPIFLAVAICIKLEDGGSIFYRREMIGWHGQRFTLLKFRTMILDADNYLEQRTELKQEYEKNIKLQHDPRVTRPGRFLRKMYLDELPQLFNVLFGHMSLVGPRPIHQKELTLYGEYAQKRHSIKPGITGLWQISPDRHKYYRERIALDMRYVENRSFLLDCIILARTIKVFFAKTGV